MNWNDNLRQGLIVNLVFSGNGSPEVTAVETYNTHDYQVLKVKEVEPIENSVATLPHNEYARLVEATRKRNRDLSHIYLFANFYRCNVYVFLQILKRSFLSFIGR